MVLKILHFVQDDSKVSIQDDIYVDGCPIRSGMTTERSEIPDQVGDDDSSGIRVDHFCLFISLWRWVMRVVILE